MGIWWEDMGFAEPPRRVVACGEEMVYRVGGGWRNLALGAFFSPIKASCVSQAELASNIVTWGNRCLYVATYRVEPGVEMWVGRVAHGSYDVADPAAEQIYIESPQFKVALVRDVEALRQDVFVSPRAGHA